MKKLAAVIAGIGLSAVVAACGRLSEETVPYSEPGYLASDKENARYLDKIWVVQDWTGSGEKGGYYGDKISFCITEIENGVVNGRLATGGIAEPVFYADSYDAPENIGNFTGKLEDTTVNGQAVCLADCLFQDAAGNQGSLEILFSSEDVLEASVTYESKAEAYADVKEGGTWKFRPYTMQDVIDSGDEGSFYVMESALSEGNWKDAYCVSVFLAGEPSHVDSFLADEQGNVLYHFGMRYQENAKYPDIKAEDVNQDGRADVEIVYQVEQEYFAGTKCVAHTFLQMEDGSFCSGDLVEDEKNRQEGRMLTVNTADSVTLYSGDGEIYIEIPSWQGFSEMQKEYDYLNYAFYAEMEDGDESFQVRYSVWKQWDAARFYEKVLNDIFSGYYERMGTVHTLDVDGMTVFYLPCYYEKASTYWERSYIIWADLGCGQILKTELRQTFDAYSADEDSIRPFHIEDMITKLYTNLKVGITGEGEIEIASGSLPDRVEENYSFYYYERFGSPGIYENDEYYENTACGGLLQKLFEAMQTGTIEELLQQEKKQIDLLPVQEKLAVIRDEASGRLGDADVNLYYNGHDLQRDWYGVEQKDGRQDILILENQEGKRYNYYYFTCYPDGSGKLWTRKGRRTEAQTDEHYFLSDNGIQYLCIPNRNEEGKIEGIALYDFDAPDDIGMLVYITKQRISVCPFVRDNGWAGYWPWYLYDTKETASLYGEWMAIEYLGASAGCMTEDEENPAYEAEQRITQRLKNEYLDGQRVLKLSSSNDYSSTSEYGYYYRSLEQLYKVYRQPDSFAEAAMEAPFCCVRVELHDTGEWVDMITDNNGKTVLYIQGRFFLVEKIEGADEALRTLEEEPQESTR